jgi:hypothetical protein
VVVLTGFDSAGLDSLVVLSAGLLSLDFESALESDPLSDFDSLPDGLLDEPLA